MLRPILAACLVWVSADGRANVARELLSPSHRAGLGVEMRGDNTHWTLEGVRNTSGWWWARGETLTASLEYAPARELEALEVYVAFDRNGDGWIKHSEWYLIARDDARDVDGVATTSVRDVRLPRGYEALRIVQRRCDGTTMYDQWGDDELTFEDP